MLVVFNAPAVRGFCERLQIDERLFRDKFRTDSGGNDFQFQTHRPLAPLARFKSDGPAFFKMRRSSRRDASIQGVHSGINFFRVYLVR